MGRGCSLVLLDGAENMFSVSPLPGLNLLMTVG